MQDKILILDFGSQYTQLIARRVRELNVYSEIHPWDKCPEITNNIKGVILSGSPFSVKDENSPKIDLSKIKGKVPLLGVCFGAQYLAHNFGGEVANSDTREYGRANIVEFDKDNPLLKGVPQNSQVWMSHGDSIKTLPNDFKIIASTEDVKVAAFAAKDEQTFGIQFHPEVYHSTDGSQMISNFIVNIAKCKQDWTPDAFVESTVEALQAQLGDDRVILGLSGGVDSSVAATILHHAIGENLHCIFVNNGLLRKNEYDDVLEGYKGMGLNVKGVDASEQFYAALKGLTDPEEKRKAIGKVFVDVFDEESKLVENAKWLGQGTIYPDVIESVSATGGPSQTIKSHHNVGGLPDYMKLKVVEPLRLLFKDEVRRVGKSLNISPAILGRHPFPGPGLGIRILGEVTPDKVKILQEVDAIFINELKAANLYDEVWQAGAIFLPVNTVGVMGDERTYENAVALRAVTSTDGMTADWCHLPYEVLGKISNKIINQVKGINRVTYDISSKPPATIEWE
ncbi:MAG TPA: glutamine-hydrolyzing GMP synthase [Brumimicrobium sp.]|nr:glutamine-hydrolyzing GMP synthase [Brumimicrobium sp.]